MHGLKASPEQFAAVFDVQSVWNQCDMARAAGVGFADNCLAHR